jgi:hypothetical protein
MFNGKIVVVGWPRSGTTWLTRLIIHYLDGPDTELWAHQTMGWHSQCFRVHKIATEDRERNLALGGKIVFIVRDPRDTAVSEYFFMHNKSCLGKVHSVADTTLYDYLKTVFVTGRGGWRAYVEKWLRLAQGSKDIIVVSHEALWEHRETTLLGMLRELGIEPEAEKVLHAIDASRQISNTRPAYARVQNWREAEPVVLSGRPGEWRNHFTPEATRFIEEYCGDLMRQLGYKNV